MAFVSALTEFIGFLWLSFLLLAPMLLLGLLLSGVMHVFISQDAILRWFRRDGLKSVVTSAAIGVPVPLCSCSVVPVVAELRHKGASRSACMSFLITAPETGPDSILVTNAFFGPVVAVVRPVVSFITAVVAALFCIGLIRDSAQDHTATRMRTDQREHDHGHGEDHTHEHASLFLDRDDCYVSLNQLGDFAVRWLRTQALAVRRWGIAMRSIPLKFGKRRDPPIQRMAVPLAGKSQLKAGPDFLKVIQHVFRYGFVEIADDILFALLVGIVLGGVLYLAIPTDLMAHEHAQWFAYPVMVLIGVPLYICASASTPIAAALVAKGVSPGAALIFLMTGPATNTGTIAIIVSQFGARFATVYVLGVVVVTVVLGIFIDLLLFASGISIAVNLDASESPAILVLQWGGLIGLVALIIWRFRAGALRSGYDDLMMNIKPVGRRIASLWRRSDAGVS